VSFQSGKTATTRVSVASDGTEGNGSAGDGFAISGDGTQAAFQSLASNLVTLETVTGPRMPSCATGRFLLLLGHPSSV